MAKNINNKSVSGERGIDRPVVLVGMMGAGKTTVGKRLAQRLGLPFVDADAEIEQAADMSINEIFERFGEDYFRDGERRVIARLMDGQPKVIATGGGAFTIEETRREIVGNAITIWLDADIATLAERVSRRDNRPLVKGKDAREVLEVLASERNPAYSQADIRVKSAEGPHSHTVEKIMEALTQWLG